MPKNIKTGKNWNNKKVIYGDNIVMHTDITRASCS